MVLIPLSGSGTRGDQVENARIFVKAGAAVALGKPFGTEANPETLSATIAAIAEDRVQQNAMAAASARIGRLDGVPIIAEQLLHWLGAAKGEPCSI